MYRKEMDCSLLFTIGPVVATVPYCISYYGAAWYLWPGLKPEDVVKRARTYTHAHRDTAEAPALWQHSFPAWLGAESLKDLLPLSTYFLGISLNFAWQTALVFTPIAGVSYKPVEYLDHLYLSSKPMAFG